MEPLIDRLRYTTHNIDYESFDPSTLFSQQTTDKKYKLMIKTHWETGVNYLCITKRKDFRKYTGSGVRWKTLLKARPGPVFTYLLFSTDSIEELNEACLEHSIFFNIPDNPLFANLIPELGYTRDPDAIITYDAIRCAMGGKNGGVTSRDTQVGIHDPKYNGKRTEWAKIGAQALNESGNRSGIFDKDWRDQNVEFVKKTAANGGKVGGKITGNMLWWNNGESNIRSIDCPGDGWVNGMLMSGKKKAQCANWGQTRPTAGKKCINDGVRNKMVNPEEMDQYISEGWFKGKIKIKGSNNGK